MSRSTKAPRSRSGVMLGRAAGKGHGSPAGRRSRDAREHHKSWRHVGLAEPLRTAGDMRWCPEGHRGDVPVLHELEGQGLHLRTGGRGLAAHLPITQAGELPYKALSDQEPHAWEQPARPPSMQHDSLLSKALGFVQSPCCTQTSRWTSPAHPKHPCAHPATLYLLWLCKRPLCAPCCQAPAVRATWSARVMVRQLAAVGWRGQQWAMLRWLCGRSCWAERR